MSTTGGRGRRTRSILDLDDDTESPIRKRTEDFSDDEEEINRDLAPVGVESIDLNDSSGGDDQDNDDEEEDIQPRRRTKSVYMGDGGPVANPAPRRSLDPRNGSRRALKDREKRALEEGLEYHGEGVSTTRRRAPSLDGSDVSDSDVERPSLDGDRPPQRPLANRKLRRLKLLMLGDIGVGKTSLMRRWTGESVEAEMVSTVGVDFTTKVVDLKGEQLEVKIWDTAGQERFHVITHSYYKGCNGILLVYDAENAAPKKLHYWIDNIQRHAGHNVEVLLLCNKIDLLPVDKAEQSGQVLSGREIAKEMDIPLFLTSAMTGRGVDQAFNYIVEKCAIAEQRPLAPYKQNAAHVKGCAPVCTIS